MTQREGKVSHQQKDVMLDYMEQHKPLAQGKVFRSESGLTYHELWDELTIILNNTTGPKKDKIKWQRVWCDIKQKIRLKIKEINVLQITGAPHQLQLTPLENRIINVMREKSDENIEFENNTNESELKLIPRKTYTAKNIAKTIYVDDIPTTSKEIETIFYNESSLESKVFQEQNITQPTNNEENSNSSWNSHEYRTGKAEKKETDLCNKDPQHKIDTISLQLEQIVEQNNVTNILLERIAKALES